MPKLIAPSVQIEVLCRDIGLFDVCVTGLDVGNEADVRVVVSTSLGLASKISSPLSLNSDGIFTARVKLPESDDTADVAVEIFVQSPAGAYQRSFSLADFHASIDAPHVTPPVLDVPPWAMGRVWYQVFPERFDNGNAANDPADPAICLKPWSSPWWDVSPDEVERAFIRREADPVAFGGRPDAEAGVFSTTVFSRRYGGDLQGVVRRLDHLKQLGVDGLYLCPVFQSGSLHKYDAADHRHVDATFGGNRPAQLIDQHDPSETHDPATWRWAEADRYLLDVVLPEARSRGMRVMLDGVWNHVGLDHWAFHDVRQRGKASRYSDWFAVEFDDAGHVANWDAWDGRNGSLPVFRQTDEGDLAPGAKAHVFDITRRWMDPNGDGDPSDGVDGWRLDVAAEVGRRFWADWRALVKSINPDALIVAELWFDGAAYFDGSAFDAQMNYPFAFAVTEWLGRDPNRTSHEAASALTKLWRRSSPVDLAQLTLLASHDTARLGSMMDNPGVGYDTGASTDDVFRGNYKRGPVSARGRRLSALGAAIQAVAPGAPMVYGGDEFGLAGPDDPNNRQPIIWPEMAPDVDASRRPSMSVMSRYRDWLRLRRDPRCSDVLRFGDVRVRAVEGAPDVLVVERRLNGVVVVAAFNRGDRGVPVKALELPDGVEAILMNEGAVAPLSAAIWWVPRR